MFSWLFKPRQKDPLEMLQLLLESLSILHSNNSGTFRCLVKPKKNASKALHHLKLFFTGSVARNHNTDNDYDSNIEDDDNNSNNMSRHEVLSILTNEALRAGILEALTGQLYKLDFETRKDAVTVFSCFLRRKIGSYYPAIQILLEDEEDVVLKNILNGHEIPEMALFYGKMLREVSQFDLLLKRILRLSNIMKIFDYAKLSTFDLASDATASLKDLLFLHPKVSLTFLMINHEEIFSHLNSMSSSDNYITTLQGLKILREILNEKEFLEVSELYMCDPENLKLVMNLMRSRHKNIQNEAFFIFILFVEDLTTRPKGIQDIIFRNKEKLVKFIDDSEVGLFNNAIGNNNNDSISNNNEDDEMVDRGLVKRAFIVKRIKSFAPLNSNNTSIDNNSSLNSNLLSTENNN